MKYLKPIIGDLTGNATTATSFTDGKKTSDFAPSGYGLGQIATRLAGGYDLNTVRANGWYDVLNPVNGVSSLSWHSILVACSGDSGYLTQMAFSMVENFNQVWTRTCWIGTSWTSWKQLATTDQIPTTLPANGGTATNVSGGYANLTGKSYLNQTNHNHGGLQIANPSVDGEASIGYVSGATALGDNPTSSSGDGHVWVGGIFTNIPNRWGLYSKQSANQVFSVDTNGTINCGIGLGKTVATTNQIPTSLPANGGNAATATKLATAHTINGVLFDGTTDITVVTTTSLNAIKYNVAGTYSFTQPDGVDIVYVTMFGSGGGGGGGGEGWQTGWTPGTATAGSSGTITSIVVGDDTISVPGGGGGGAGGKASSSANGAGGTAGASGGHVGISGSLDSSGGAGAGIGAIGTGRKGAITSDSPTVNIAKAPCGCGGGGGTTLVGNFTKHGGGGGGGGSNATIYSRRPIAVNSSAPISIIVGAGGEGGTGGSGYTAYCHGGEGGDGYVLIEW